MPPRRSWWNRPWVWIPATVFVVLLAVSVALGPPPVEEAATASSTTAPPPAETSPTVPPTTEATEPPPPEYTPFDQVDPYLSLYFIILEDTTLAASQGEERLYNLGLGVCRNLDGGNSIGEELAGLVDDARLTQGEAGSLVGAAVTDLCPHHGGLVKEHLATNG